MVLTALLGVLVSLTPLANAQATSTPGNNQTSQTTNTGQQNTSSQEKSPEPTESNNLIKAGKEYDKGAVATFIYDILISIGGFFVWLGGLALDTSISLLVVGMGEFVRSTMLVAINELWTIVRDIFNILFIFGLIYIGFKTILGTDETGTKRALVMLIAAALLINFSLLFTKAIVDFSNATAFQIYGLLGGAEATYQTTQDSTPTKGIAASFMQVADLTSFANTQSQDSLEKMSDTNFIIYGLFTMFLMLIAAFVFLAGAFMLVARFVILIFSMIFSPAMFLGWIFPQFDKLSSQWWHRFLSNAFMAPAFLFMIFLTLKSIQTINHNGSLFDAFQGNSYLTDSFGVIIIFFVMIGFLYGSLLVSQRLGGQGASLSMKAAHTVRRKAQLAVGTVAIGGAAGLARNTIGRKAQQWAESEALKEKASKGGPGGWAARQRLKTFTSVGDSSFDARNIGGVGKKLDLGQGNKGGYKSSRDAVVKKEKEFSKSLGEVSDDDPQVMERRSQVEEQKSKIKRMKEGKDEEGNDKNYTKAEIEREQNILNTRETALKQEKQRRQTGSVEYNEWKKNNSKQIEESKLNINRLEQEQKNKETTPERRAEIKNEIDSYQSKLNLAQTQTGKPANAGYAGVLEQQGTITSWLQGRTKDQNQQAGKAVRKEHASKIKRSKEDERFDSLREEVGKSNNKNQT